MKRALSVGLVFVLLLSMNLKGVAAIAFDELHGSHAGSPHHLSVFNGATELVEGDHTAFTLGIDYEYRVTNFLGLGIVLERAFGSIDSTTVLGVADLHLWKGLIAQVGPGFEVVDDDTHAALRLGVLYELELEGGFTVSPQFHYDFSHEDALVFGLAIGRAF